MGLTEAWAPLDDETALMAAAANRRVGIVGHLLSAGARVDLQGRDGATALSPARKAEQRERGRPVLPEHRRETERRVSAHARMARMLEAASAGAAGQSRSGR